MQNNVVQEKPSVLFLHSSNVKIPPILIKQLLLEHPCQSL